MNIRLIYDYSLESVFLLPSELGSRSVTRREYCCFPTNTQKKTMNNSLTIMRFGLSFLRFESQPCFDCHSNKGL